MLISLGRISVHWRTVGADKGELPQDVMESPGQIKSMFSAAVFIYKHVAAFSGCLGAEKPLKSSGHWLCLALVRDYIVWLYLWSLPLSVTFDQWKITFGVYRPVQVRLLLEERVQVQVVVRSSGGTWPPRSCHGDPAQVSSSSLNLRTQRPPSPQPALRFSVKIGFFSDHK